MIQEAVEFVCEKSRSLDFRFVVPHVKSLEVATPNEQAEKSTALLGLEREKGTQGKPLSSGLERQTCTHRESQLTGVTTHEWKLLQELVPEKETLSVIDTLLEA